MKQPWKKSTHIKTNFGVPSSKVKTSLSRRGNYKGDIEQWKAFTREIFERDNYTCCRCGKHRSEFEPGITLQCHHIKRISRGGTDTKANNVSICSKCHALEDGHQHMRK